MKDPMIFKELLDSVVTVPANDDPKPEKTFLSIAGFDHLERSWSSIYAYLFDENESHGLKGLFKKSLEKVICRKTGRKIDLSGGTIHREYPTNDNNRIDILIQAPEHTVIIENKVFHRLNNDLDDYWTSIRVENEAKTGVVLTLTHILTNNSNYINIIHSELLEEVERGLVAVKGEISSQIALLLSQFIDNVKKVSGRISKSEMDFYLASRDRINRLSQIATNARQWMQSVFTDTAFIRSLGKFTLVHTDREGSKYRYAMYRLWDTDELVVTVFYESLWNSKPGEAHLWLYLEPVGRWLEKAVANEVAIRSIAKAHGLSSPERRKTFWHCAAQKIAVPDEMLANEEALKGYLVDNLHNTESNIMSAAREIYHLLSASHKPTYQWEDALKKLKELLPEDNEDNAAFWCTPLQYIAFDPRTRIVIVEVIDNLYRDRLELEYHDAFMEAIRFAFGKDTRYSIVCRSFYH